MVNSARGYNNEGIPLRSRDRHAIMIPSKLHPSAGKGGMCLAEIMVNHAERALTQSRVGSDLIGSVPQFRVWCKAARFPEFLRCARAGTHARSDFKFKIDILIPYHMHQLNPNICNTNSYSALQYRFARMYNMYIYYIPSSSIHIIYIYTYI